MFIEELNKRFSNPLLCDFIGMFKFAREECCISMLEFESLINDREKFNNGCCTAFTSYVSTKIENSIIEDSSIYMEYLKTFCKIDYGVNYHEFLRVENKFYDFECLNGVFDLKDLPFFKRISF